MSIALRDYQAEAINAVIGEFASGVSRQLISLPTGSGKTIVMAAIAKHFNKRTLLLAHREELIQQAVDKFKLYWPEVSIGVCMADRDEVDRQVVVGSVQSCYRQKRLVRLNEQGFEVMMIDEAHHSPADSYQSILRGLGFAEGTGKLLVGVTATPSRADKVGLGNTFDKIVFNRSIGTMIKAGYLSPVVGRKILTSFAVSGIRTYSGDFSPSELSRAVNTPERNEFIVQKYKSYAQDRKGVAFCADVQHCKDLAKALKKAGIESKAVWGDMASDERKNSIAGFKSGRIQVLTSCGILTEGYDEPSVNAIIMARPTKSPSLYVQCVGRGLRLWPGKQDCLVLDFNDKHHNLDSIVSLTSTIPEAIHVREEREEGEAKETAGTQEVQVIEDVDQEFDVVGNTRFIWVDIGDGEWSLQDDQKLEIVMSPSGNGYIAMLYVPNNSTHPIVKEPLPFEYCSGVCEDFARKNLKISFCDLKTWMNIPASPTSSQSEFLKNQGLYRDGMTKAEAGLEIRKIIALKSKQRRQTPEPITPKQKFFLDCKGINTENMTKLQAIQVIAQLKKDYAKHEL